MHPMLGDIELAAADCGMGDFQHGICPRYVYGAYCTVPRATVNCGMRIADCGLARGQRNGVDPQMPQMTQIGENRGTATAAAPRQTIRG
jgi:hypothetical protein